MTAHRVPVHKATWHFQLREPSNSIGSIFELSHELLAMETRVRDWAVERNANLLNVYQNFGRGTVTAVFASKDDALLAKLSL